MGTKVAQNGRPLTRLLLLSVAAAAATMALKTLAWRLTGSVGFLSDALESVVNLAAALVAISALRWATSPPDEEHLFGHEKAEYFSAGFEGGLILLAAASIAWTAIGRLIDPQPLADVAIGGLLSGLASVVNLAVGVVLIRAGRRNRSITLEADGRHLLTDVWTSVAVIAGVLLVAATGLPWLDPVVALVVAANIVVTGVTLLRRAVAGLMDRALPAAEQHALQEALEPYRRDGIKLHSIRTRQAGRRSFVSLHVLVPGDWTVQRGHETSERIEADVCRALPGSVVMTHIEPIEDPSSLDDGGLDRPLVGT